MNIMQTVNRYHLRRILTSPSLVSLFYGEGDIQETIKIASLAGWDSAKSNRNSGRFIGFMIGKKGIEHNFRQKVF